MCNVKKLVTEIFIDGTNCEYKQKWEYFMYMIRGVAMNRS